MFAGAAAEAARRSDEARHVAEAEAVRVSTLQRRSIRKRRILLLLVGASLIATFLTVVVVFTQVGMS